MPFSLQNLNKVYYVLWGCNSTYKTVGFILAYDKISLNRETPTLHIPIFLTNPSATSYSIAYHVSCIGTESSSIRGFSLFGS